MALILTGKKVDNAVSYTINFFKIVDGSAEETPSVSVNDIPQPEGEMFNYNLTNVSDLEAGVSYKVTCQAHAASDDPFWTDSLIQTVEDSCEIVPSTTSE